MKTRLAYKVEASNSDEFVAVRSHDASALTNPNAQPQHFLRSHADGVVERHRTTTSELPFT